MRAVVRVKSLNISAPFAVDESTPNPTPKLRRGALGADQVRLFAETGGGWNRRGIVVRTFRPELNTQPI